MNRTKAEKALKAVERKYARWIALSKEDGVTDPDNFPQIVEGFSFGLDKPAPFAIVWECNSPDEWALRWGSTKREDPTGVFCEPIMSFVLGVYDGD